MATTAGTEAATAGLVRRGDPATSVAAAASLRDLRASQREVLELFRRFGPMDDKDLLKCARAAGVKQSPSGLRTRRSELVQRTLVVDSGRRLPGDGAHPRECTVWKLAAGV